MKPGAPKAVAARERENLPRFFPHDGKGRFPGAGRIARGSGLQSAMVSGFRRHMRIFRVPPGDRPSVVFHPSLKSRPMDREGAATPVAPCYANAFGMVSKFGTWNQSNCP